MHVNTEALIDIAEGTRPESAAPHLASCQRCRAQLHDLRAMISAAREVDVPDPSPLFWDHLSARISAAVAAESASARPKPSRDFAGTLAALFGGRAFQASAVVAVLAMLLAVVLMPPTPPPSSSSAPRAAAVADAAAPLAPPELLGDVMADDPSLTLVAGLASTLDLDAASAAGLAPSGSAEHAVTHMSDGELRELRRLLQQEFTRSGV